MWLFVSVAWANPTTMFHVEPTPQQALDHLVGYCVALTSINDPLLGGRIEISVIVVNGRVVLAQPEHDKTESPKLADCVVKRASHMNLHEAQSFYLRRPYVVSVPRGTIMGTPPSSNSS